MINPTIKAELNPRLPLIRDDILILLNNKTFQNIQDKFGKIQLKNEILAAVNKHLSPGKIVNVYFTDFVVQDVN